MAKVCFAPFFAIRYAGEETKEFSHSLARPKPILETGDVVIVDKKTAFNLVEKGFGEFESVNSIEIAEAEAKELAEAEAKTKKTQKK